MMLIIFIIFIIAFLTLSAGLMGVILIPMMLYRTKKIKQDAREILNSRNYDQKKFDRIYNALAKIPTDLEAAHLWKQLNALKESYNCPSCGQRVRYGWPQCYCGCRLIWG
jgi:hypothetical protein